VVARAQRTIKVYRPRQHYVEHDAEDIAHSLEAALDEVLNHIPHSTPIIAAGLACQRSTVVFWDQKTREVLARAPSWMDGRAATILSQYQAHSKRIYDRTGLYLTPFYSAPKIRWFIDHHSRVKKSAKSGRLAVGPVATYLISRWTRSEIYAIDPTLAQRMLLLNIRTQRWDPTLLNIFGLSHVILPELRPTLGDWGFIERGRRRIPLRVCIGDQQSAAFGLGANERGKAIINYGTGAFVLVNSGHSMSRIPGLLTTIGLKESGQTTYFQEGTVHSAATSFEWLHQLGLMPNVKKIDEAFTRSKQRLMVLPALGGLGAPYWLSETRAAWHGLSADTSSADIVRATAEGLCFLISDIVERMRTSSLKFTSIRLAGGLSQANQMMKFQADVLAQPLVRYREIEATAIGAAFLAARSMGIPKASLMLSVPVNHTFSPRLKPRVVRRLHERWAQFVKFQLDLSRAMIRS
jgi:glycerol kinase